MPKFTVFTPVFNRKDKIHRVWESLNKQTFRDFEWIVVDDGSTDNVIEILEVYKKEADFPVKIFQQENLGKHFAWNRAVDMAQGELFVPADSDDSFESNTLEFFAQKWESIPLLDREKYSGINVLCKDPVTQKIIGDEFPKDGIISNNLELFYKYKVNGEKWGCIRTELLRSIPYPEIIGKKNYVQAYTWFSLAKKYRVKCYNIPLRSYYYEQDSITARQQKSIRTSAYTYYHYGTWHQNNNYSYIIKYRPLYFLKLVFNTNIFGFLAGKNIFDIISEQKNVFIKGLSMIFALPSYIYYKTKYRDA